jgi:heat shock protein HslJ
MWRFPPSLAEGRLRDNRVAAMTTPTRLVALVALAPALTGCATQIAVPTSLAGTSWRLLAIDSMDDAQGTTRPGDPSRYTVTFGKDGRAAFQLDCNRASGEWKATPATANARSGQLIFSSLAGTRAMCAPGSLDQRLSGQLPYVRSYLFQDGQLHMSLLADGGILHWAPVQ